MLDIIGPTSCNILRKIPEIQNKIPGMNKLLSVKTINISPVVQNIPKNILSSLEVEVP